MLQLDNRGGVRLVTPVGRTSYVKLLNPQKRDNGDLAFGLSLLFRPEDTQALFEAAFQVLDNKWPSFAYPDGRQVTGREAWQQGLLEFPIKDGRKRPMDAAYQGMFFISPSSKEPVACVAEDGATPIDARKIYSGCYARAFISFYPFEYRQQNNGPVMKKGVGCGLNGVQFAYDGERLDNKGDPRKMFAGIALPPPPPGAIQAPQMGVPGPGGMPGMPPMGGAPMGQPQMPQQPQMAPQGYPPQQPQMPQQPQGYPPQGGGMAPAFQQQPGFAPPAAPQGYPPQQPVMAPQMAVPQGYPPQQPQQLAPQGYPQQPQGMPGLPPPVHPGAGMPPAPPQGWAGQPG